MVGTPRGARRLRRVTFGSALIVVLRRLDSDPIGLFRCIGKQRKHAGALQRRRQAALMLGAVPRLAARLDLGSLGDVAPQPPEILVVDLRDMVYAKSANLAAIVVPIFAARPRRPAGSRRSW